MFNFEEFRVRDLDEIVIEKINKPQPFNARDFAYSYFVLGKGCTMAVSCDKKSGEVRLSIENPILKEKRAYGLEGGVPFEAVDLNAVAENFLVFNHLVSGTSILRKKGADAVKTHLLLTNVDRALEGVPAPKKVEEIVSPEEYKKAIHQAKKAFNKEQEVTVDSQTPQYDL